ncbi:hypothetical protein N7461_007141 [Penicillium sp. DV-2018c]|nr:hypothetical protein N7461_007141 [Penicillium sp. DV-2018c]
MSKTCGAFKPALTSCVILEDHKYTLNLPGNILLSNIDTDHAIVKVGDLGLGEQVLIGMQDIPLLTRLLSSRLAYFLTPNHMLCALLKSS